MSQTGSAGGASPDPMEAWRAMRDQALDAWAKSMTELVNTEAFAQSLGSYLDSYLAASSQFQKAMDQYMKASLAMLRMPSRDDVANLAQRLTNVEMRLDDLHYAVEQTQRERAADTTAAALRELGAEVARLRERLDALSGAATAASSSGAAPGRTRARRSGTAGTVP